MLHEWIYALTAASAVTAIAKQLTMDANVKKVTELVCGVMLVAVLISPLLQADISSLALSLSEYRHTAAAVTQDVEALENRFVRQYIEEQCAEYILREAHTLGVEELRVTVKTKWRDENWIPYESFCKGALNPTERDRLSVYMESELGIPRERQNWDG